MASFNPPLYIRRPRRRDIIEERLMDEFLAIQSRLDNLSRVSSGPFHYSPGRSMMSAVRPLRFRSRQFPYSRPQIVRNTMMPSPMIPPVPRQPLRIYSQGDTTVLCTPEPEVLSQRSAYRAMFDSPENFMTPPLQAHQPTPQRTCDESIRRPLSSIIDTPTPSQSLIPTRSRQMSRTSSSIRSPYRRQLLPEFEESSQAQQMEYADHHSYGDTTELISGCSSTGLVVSSQHHHHSNRSGSRRTSRVASVRSNRSSPIQEESNSSEGSNSYSSIASKESFASAMSEQQSTSNGSSSNGINIPDLLQGRSAANGNGEENGQDEVSPPSPRNGFSGDDPDARITSIFSSSSTTVTERTVRSYAAGYLSQPVDAPEYCMSHPRRGRCLIINNQHFDRHTGMRDRAGSEKDAQALNDCFTDLSFEVVIITDPTANEIRQALKHEVMNYAHEEADSFCVCIMTHGEFGGVLWARDTRYDLESIFALFQGDRCPGLAGKPKLFFIQACRGEQFDSGVEVHGQPRDESDGLASYRIPSMADFLIVYSTVSGYYSWRNTVNGSWFVQSLVAVITQNRAGQSGSQQQALQAAPTYRPRKDLLSMLTIVCRQVAYNYMSNNPNNSSQDKKKQVPCIYSTLTRDIIFPN